MKLELATYTPSEAEIITGVKQSTVRNWRRAGYLPRQVGHARYSLAELLVMFSMQMLVSRGISPDAAKDFAGAAALVIFENALFDCRAYSKAATKKAEDEVERLLGGKLPEPLNVCATMQAKEILQAAARKLVGIGEKRHPAWMTIWADGELEFFEDSEDPSEMFFENIEFNQPYVQGPIIVFCLPALSRMVIGRLPHAPFLLSDGE